MGCYKLVGAIKASGSCSTILIPLLSSLLRLSGTSCTEFRHYVLYRTVHGKQVVGSLVSTALIGMTCEFSRVIMVSCYNLSCTSSYCSHVSIRFCKSLSLKGESC
jgi:hypothetical protein